MATRVAGAAFRRAVLEVGFLFGTDLEGRGGEDLLPGVVAEGMVRHREELSLVARSWSLVKNKEKIVE